MRCKDKKIARKYPNFPPTNHEFRTIQHLIPHCPSPNSAPPVTQFHTTHPCPKRKKSAPDVGAQLVLFANSRRLESELVTQGY